MLYPSECPRPRRREPRRYKFPNLHKAARRLSEGRKFAGRRLASPSTTPAATAPRDSAKSDFFGFFAVRWFTPNCGLHYDENEMTRRPVPGGPQRVIPADDMP